MATSLSLAHEGHDHGGGAAATQGNAPHRRADGTIFLPKPTQRLLEVRTEIVQPREAVRTERFAGRVIPNPNRSGLVQGTIGGRIATAAGGLPRLGQAVKAGEVLAYVQPSFQPVDAATLQQTEGDLDQQIALYRSRIDRRGSWSSATRCPGSRWRRPRSSFAASSAGGPSCARARSCRSRWWLPPTA